MDFIDRYTDEFMLAKSRKTAAITTGVLATFDPDKRAIRTIISHTVQDPFDYMSKAIHGSTWALQHWVAEAKGEDAIAFSIDVRRDNHRDGSGLVSDDVEIVVRLTESED